MNMSLKRTGCVVGAMTMTVAVGMSAANGAGQIPSASPNGMSQHDAMITSALRAQVTNIVVIYAENRAFDGLYGNFPGAHGLSEVVDPQGKPTQKYTPQTDRDGSVLPNLPPTWGGVTAAGVTPAVTQAQSTGLPNAPFSIETGFTLNLL